MADTHEEQVARALPPHLYAMTIRTDDGTLHEGDTALLSADERDAVIDVTTDFLVNENSVITMEAGDAFIMLPVRKIISASLIMMDPTPETCEHAFVPWINGETRYQRCEKCGRTLLDDTDKEK